MRENKNITPEFLNSLPIRQINMGGTLKTVRYDDEHKRIYLLDANGNFTGHSGNADLTGNPQKPEQEQEPPKNDNTSDPVPEEKEPELVPPPFTEPDPEEPAEEFEEQESGKWKKLLVVFGAAAVFIAAIVLIAKLISGAGDPAQPPSGTETTAASTAAQTAETTVPEHTTAPTEQTVPPTEPEVKISVLTAASTLLPGEKISLSGIVVQEISENEYAALTAMGGVYIQGEEALLEGFVATQYIPQGSYLWRNCAGRSYAPANPWGAVESGFQTVRIPVNLQPNQIESALFGTQVDVKIVIQTKLTTDNPVPPDAEEQDTSGLQHDSSTVESMVIDTYIVPDALVVDVLNSRGNSLYADFSALATIPAPYRNGYLQNKYSALSDMDTMIPTYICISVPQQQAEFLDTLDTSNMTVSITEATPSVKTALQADSYAAIKEAAGSIADVWTNLIAEESEA